MALKVTAIFPYTTLLPQDVAQNTFYFRTVSTEATPAEITTAIGAVARLYIVGGTAPDPVKPLGEWLGDIIDEDEFRIRCVSFDPATGDEIGEATISEHPELVVGNNCLPLEVAFCLSFRAAWTTPAQQARRRGRVYLGPLAPAVLVSTPPPAPIVDLMEAGAFYMERLLSESVAGVGGGDPAPWCVWSRTDGSLHDVVGGWVDNEWDTQRRRGLRPTYRETWGLSGL